MKRFSHAAPIAVAFLPVFCVVPAAAQRVKASTAKASTAKASTANSSTSKLQPKRTQPNAYDLYLRAGKALDYAGEGTDFTDFNDLKLNAPFRSPLARREFVLRRNARALSLMRQGFQYSYLQPTPRDPTDVFFPSFARMRQLARLLHVEADVYAAHGQYAKALSSSLDAIRLGTDVPRGGALISLLVGIAIEGIGFSDLKKARIEHLDARSAQTLARRLEALDKRRLPFTQTLKNEKDFGTKQLRYMFKDPKWRKEFPTTQTPAQITTTYKRLMDKAIINAALPYTQRRGIVEKVDEVNKNVVGIFLSDDAAKPSYAASGLFVERSRALSRLIITMLALRAFKVEHGKYPATLNELAPRYLSRMPMDPFADNQPLRYKRTGIEYSLYSVGYDGVDDGGKALPKRTQPNAKGDIVAGINTK